MPRDLSFPVGWEVGVAHYCIFADNGDGSLFYSRLC